MFEKSGELPLDYTVIPERVIHLAKSNFQTRSNRQKEICRTGLL